MAEDIPVTGEAAITDESQALVTAHHATNTDIAKLAEVTGQNLPPSLQIMLDDRLFARITQLARQMSTDTVFTPRHLRGKESACFTVLNMALDMKLNPQFVARATYETPGGSIGFEGKLVLAILEQSGRFVGGITFQHVGDWSKITGKFEMISSPKGGQYPKATWTDKDAAGLGVIVRGQLRHETTPRVWPSEDAPFMLTQCHPRSSPLWSTDPATQICYLAARRFATIAVPNLLGGMMFDHEEFLDASDRARDITPVEPQTVSEAKTATAQAPMADTVRDWPFVRWNGEPATMPTRKKAIEAVEKILEARAKHGLEALDAAWNNNDVLIVELREAGYGDEADGLEGIYCDLRMVFTPPVEDVAEPVSEPVEDGMLPAGDEPPEDSLIEPDMEPSLTDMAEAADEPEEQVPAEPQQDLIPPEPSRTRQSRDRHDAFWDARSLTINPPAGKGKGILDWKLWPVLIQQRINQAWTKETLDTLYLHNEQNFALYATARGDRDCTELKEEFNKARQGLPFAAEL